MSRVTKQPLRFRSRIFQALLVIACNVAMNEYWSRSIRLESGYFIVAIHGDRHRNDRSARGSARVHEQRFSESLVSRVLHGISSLGLSFRWALPPEERRDRATKEPERFSRAFVSYSYKLKSRGPKNNYTVRTSKFDVILFI